MSFPIKNIRKNLKTYLETSMCSDDVLLLFFFITIFSSLLYETKNKYIEIFKQVQNKSQTCPSRPEIAPMVSMQVL